MDEHCRDHEEMFRMTKEIHSALIGNVKEPGIYERVRSLESLKKYVIGLTITVVGYVGQAVYSFIISGLTK